ncbi:MAG: hypothetical protein ACYC3I_21045, partial [Gemmataceae bacterium]
QVGDDFHTQQSRFGGVHPFSLHTSSIPENHPEDKRTVCLYTDDKETLRLAVARSEQARSAGEVWQAGQRQRQAEAQARRQAWWQRQWRRWTATLRERAVRQQRQMTEAAQRRAEFRGRHHV